MTEQRPRLRRATLPADVIGLVRDDTCEADQDRQDAVAFARRYADCPGYGVSGFYAVTDEGIDDLASDLLQRPHRYRRLELGRREEVGRGTAGARRGATGDSRG